MLTTSFQFGHWAVYSSLNLNPRPENRFKMEKCPICLESFTECSIEDKVELACEHVLHSSCLNNCIKAIGPICPVDRLSSTKKVHQISFTTHPSLHPEDYTILLKQGFISHLIDTIATTPENVLAIAGFCKRFLPSEGEVQKHHQISKKIQAIGQMILDYDFQLGENQELPPLKTFQEALDQFKTICYREIEYFVSFDGFSPILKGSSTDAWLINLLRLCERFLKTFSLLYPTPRRQNLTSIEYKRFLQSWAKHFLMKLSNGSFSSLTDETKVQYLEVCVSSMHALITEAAKLFKELDDALYQKIANEFGPKSKIKRHSYVLLSSTAHLQFIQTILENKNDPLSFSLKNTIIFKQCVGTSINALCYIKLAAYLYYCGAYLTSLAGRTEEEEQVYLHQFNGFCNLVFATGLMICFFPPHKSIPKFLRALFNCDNVGQLCSMICFFETLKLIFPSFETRSV